MQIPSESPQNENTYVIDPESAAEMARLLDQDLLVTKHMGGLLTERPDFANIHRVLDIGCGPGGWVQEVAFAHSDIEVIGIDISQKMIQYARAQAKVQGLDNTRFLVMDATKPLDFPDNYFDLVNGRALTSFLHPTMWSTLIQECWRITRSDGIIRLTEADSLGITTSPALGKLYSKIMQAFHLSGRCFSSEGQYFGITPKLGYFLRKVGYQKLRKTPHILDYSAGEEAHDSMYRDWTIALKLVQPFLLTTKVATQEEADALYQQAMMEMRAEDFTAISYSLSVWGEKP
jgi:ubiquinone/menaquinone biosynthesis C-methylase UbiE